jgi:hypothetical protein
MANMMTAKLHWSSVQNTPKARYMCLDIKNIYLTVPLSQFKYTKMLISLFLPWIIAQYDLEKKVVRGGYIYLQMRIAIWGLPQADILANKLLCNRLTPHSYYKCKSTPGLWKHTTHPVTFTVVVDKF